MKSTEGRMEIIVLFAFLVVVNGKITPPKTDWNKMAYADLEAALKLTYNTNLAKNIILFIGDGMGVSTVTAARIYKGQLQNKPGEETILKFEEFPHVALSKTYGNDRQVPDSAQTATALMSGEKTNFYVVNYNDKVTHKDCANEIDENKLKSILHHFNEAGRSTGIVTTARLTHATPASAYAHSSNRDWEHDSIISKDIGDTFNCKDIAYQLIHNNSDIQVAMGGGRTMFLPNTTSDPEDESKGKRTDNRDLTRDWKDIQIRKNRRYKFVRNKGDFDNIDVDTTDYVLGLFQSSHMQYEGDRDSSINGEPSLTEMTEKAIKILKKNSKGFFLLVEGARMDHAHHDNTARKALEETISMESAVIKALELTNEDDSLIIVTADHSHTFTVGGYPYRGNDILGLAHPLEYEPSLDGKPYTSLAYGNGLGYNLNGTRQNLTNVDTTSRAYLQQSAVPVSSETHGGEDVAIFARGPMSHLIHGVKEQHYVGHVMQYAACVGRYSQNCERRVTDPCGPSSGGHTLTINIFTFFSIVLTLYNIQS